MSIQVNIPNPSPNDLLNGNKKWAAHLEERIPGFFSSSAGGQQPRVFWIGCVDSRVPETVLTNSLPGQIFTHRNIANQFQSDDVSVQATLEYAVTVLGVQHVIVVGHSNCGGVKTALENATGSNHVIPGQFLPRWLEPLVNLARRLGFTSSSPEDLQRFTNDNICEQVEEVRKSDTIQSSWASGNGVTVHGWLYELESGLLHEWITCRPPGGEGEGKNGS